MKRKKASRGLFLVFAGLLSATAAASLARGLPPRPDAAPPAVEALYNSGSYHQAATELQSAIEHNPQDPSLYYWLGRCYFEVHDFDRAIFNWERAVSLDSGRSEYHDWLGRAYGRKAEQAGHLNMASALSLARKTHHEFEVAVRLNARNMDAQRDLISFMAGAPSSLGGGEDHAMAQIRSLSAIDTVEGTLALADFYAERKKFEQASAKYQEALKSAPNRIAVDLEVADYYGDRGDAEHMEQAVAAAAEAAPADRRLNYYHGVLLTLEKRDPEIAERDLRAYIKSVPDNSELPSHSSAYGYLGKLCENRGRPDLAVEQYKAGLELDPQNKTLRESLKRLRDK